MPIILPPGGTISEVGFIANAASATTNWRVGLYSDNAGAMDTLLASQTSLTAGVAIGANSGTLASPYTNGGAAPITVYLATVTDTAGFNIQKTGVHVVRYWNNGGSTFPGTAPGQTGNTNGWCLYGC